MPPPKFYDPSSFSNPGAWKARHVKLQLRVNFGQRVIDGTADIDFDRVQGSDSSGDIAANASWTELRTIVLDTSALSIRTIYRQNEAHDSLTELPFRFTEQKSGFGQALEITLDNSTTRHAHLTIEYSTSAEASGLIWMPPEQTAGGQHPYLYSQCQPIHARSVFPCQDTPFVKTTFDVQVIVPEPLVALVGALPRESSRESGNGSLSYQFSTPLPIPSYLFAIAVGALSSRRIGPRSTVWSEASLVEAAAFEFSETESMLATAESIIGEYQWVKYDILVLPPSFQYGGMENPTLTFATPTILAGDRSLADVIAHEISHSWTGNLVTNYNWEHFWLNEGFTVFLERKIIGRMRGEQHRQFSAILGYRELRAAVEHLGATNPLTQLVPDLKSAHPDDAFSKVPYEKGHTLLYHLEMLVGGAAEFEPFLRRWIADNQGKSVTTQDFVGAFECAFPKRMVDWDAWLYTPGMPPIEPHFEADLATACNALARRWLDAPLDTITAISFPLGDYANDLSTQQRIEFLGLLSDSVKQLGLAKVNRLGELYALDLSRNAEIRVRWLRIGLQSHRERSIALAIQFATEQGRMKYTRPIFRDLYAWEVSRATAVDAFKRNRHRMASVAAGLLAKDLHIE